MSSIRSSLFPLDRSKSSISLEKALFQFHPQVSVSLSQQLKTSTRYYLIEKGGRDERKSELSLLLSISGEEEESGERMGDSESYRRILNPCRLHLQKMELELKCPVCLNLLSQPILLPCNHILCSPCTPRTLEPALGCPVCRLPYLHQDLRPAQHMENMVNIYKSTYAAFSASLSLPMSQANLSGQPCKKGVAEERDVNQLRQAFPDSPPSFGNNKDSDDDSNYPGSEHCKKRSPAKVAIKKESKCGGNPEAKAILPSSLKTDPSIRKSESSGRCKDDVNGIPTPPSEEDITREPKRQKPNCELHYMSSNTSFQMNENLAVACAFCQFSKESEASGPMLHYSNGRAVPADQATGSSIIHAHERCVEWAPQVYFVGETAMNLDAEVARGAKIKCSGCGKKGAALGCYAKSCHRSYHIPCAAEIPECRWNDDKFYLFCPMHSSPKLRNSSTKSGKKKRASHSPVTQLASPQELRLVPPTTQESNKCWMASSDVTGQWLLCGSGLSTAEKDLVTEFASLTGATFTKDWKPNVTHVIASTDEMGACSRTLKFLMAILSGTWILKIDWIKACMEAKCPVNEEPYEISCDVHGCSDGPKNGRIRKLEKAPKLFDGLNFYFSGDFLPSYKGYLNDLVRAAGGNVQVNKDTVSQDFETKTTSSTNIVIYNRDAPPSCDSAQLSSVMEQRQVDAEAFASKTGSQAFDHTWLLESIAACKLQSLVS